MAKKKYKEKVKTVVVQPTDEQVRRVLIENTPMKEEMESWMGCKMFTLSCLTLHATLDDLIKYTQQLQLECVPEWFADNRQMRDFMHCYLGDIEQLLKMVRDLKLVRPHEDEEETPSNSPSMGRTSSIEWSDNEILTTDYTDLTDYADRV